MTAPADTSSETTKKGGVGPLVFGALLCLLGAGGGYFAVASGLVAGLTGAGKPTESYSSADAIDALPVFVALDPLVISLPGNGGRDHLRFAAQLEVAPDRVSEVEAVKPRIVDALNGYLRAVEVAQLEDPAALIRMRAHMLRRAQVAAGEGRVKDLLIMEFVLS